ncbi:hypothetical protein SDRG_05346 [Saprolegnia diclina VS20]|uniref:EGF-like domain-containing protein n=1 Tax=Saprolegnia diclina (strain VS20) TaxID=1156394 RepID=T0QGM3_SAPDV|nr:hypothetical protein SDRG_05346 [Saprolegnia diclina VS20]EQC37119.1 hypothetical protein SDRG_05346 [Saprolegnia diclina VS20]|eukprot:XP_008609281.1 hypothetical protein SDRG_05346 [Saprolegnia diclina VS20]
MKTTQWMIVGLLSVVAAAPAPAPIPTLDRFNGVCSSDEDCAKFPGTVCVQILSGDYSQGKCTPNYGTRPNGFNGPTCGGKLDICAGVTCSGGGYTSGASGKACTCFCPKCPAGTTCTACGGADGRDCSTCPASTRLNASSTLHLAGLVAALAACFTLLL